MSFYSMKRLSLLAAGAGLLAIVAACSPEGHAPADHEGAPGGGQAEVSGSSTMPPIYISSRIENLREGENPWRANYRQMLDVCQEAGHPITELAPEEVELIGVTRLERWYGPDDYAIRLETWSYGSPGEMPDQICQFHIASKGHHTHFDRTKIVTIDLATGERTQRGPEPDVFERAVYDENEGRDPTVVAALRQQMGAQHARSVAGQTCDQRIVDNKVEICTWSGGRQWGFRTLMPTPLQTDHSTALRTRIILEQASDIPGYPHVKTEVFTIGAPLDRSALQPRP